MKITGTPIKIESIILSSAKNRKKIAANLAEASKYDSKSAYQLKKGNYEQAAYYAILAQEYISIASEAKREDIKLYALYN